MKVYESIISILERKGPLPIPSICHELNEELFANRKKPLLPSHIKSIVTKKKDLFDINGENISIHPNIYPISLSVSIDGYSGPSYQVRINFLSKRFIMWEWRGKEYCEPFSPFQPKKAGNVEEFKRELYSIKIWQWEPGYQKEEGIILEGKYWSVQLKTKGKIYESDGTDCFPPNWFHFCRAIERLTGCPFC